jgi:hypothetical protein
MQLQQQRGRLPPKKEASLRTILISEILHYSLLWKQYTLVPQQRNSNLPPQIGEIDLEKTCGITPPRQPYEFFIQTKRSTRPHISLLIDVSTSITAKQRFMSLVLAFALYQHPLDLSISIFSTTSQTIYNSNHHKTPFEILDHYLHSVLPGYTNLNAGLKNLENQRKRSNVKRNISIVISDCVSNYGPQPHRNDFFLPELILLCFRPPSTKSITGFQGVPTLSINSMKTLAIAFSHIRNHIIENP